MIQILSRKSAHDPQEVDDECKDVDEDVEANPLKKPKLLL